MIILHNSQDAASRVFVEVYGAEHTVIDWYVDHSGYTGPSPSAFPSVVVDVPAYILPAITFSDGSVAPQRLVPAKQELVRAPVTWDDVIAAQANFVPPNATLV